MAFYYPELPEIDPRTWRKQVRGFLAEWSPPRQDGQAAGNDGLDRSAVLCCLHYDNASQARACLEVHTAHRSGRSKDAPERPRRRSSDYISRIRIPDLDEPLARAIKFILARKHWSDSDLYHHAGVNRQTYNAFMSVSARQSGGKTRLPKKITLIQLAFALMLEIDEVEDLLLHAGFAFSPSILWDVVIKSCFENHIWHVLDVNEILHREGCKELLDTGGLNFE